MSTATRPLHTKVGSSPAKWPAAVSKIGGFQVRDRTHIIWACPQDPFPEIPSEERWEASLRSPDPDLQVKGLFHVGTQAMGPWSLPHPRSPPAVPAQNLGSRQQTGGSSPPRRSTGARGRARLNQPVDKGPTSSAPALAMSAANAEQQVAPSSTRLHLARADGWCGFLKRLEGTVQFDGYVIEGATSLWCAAGAGHVDIGLIFVRNGVDVNHPARTVSTTLRAASFDGRLDIVRSLVEHNADIHLPNNYNNTCLTIAAYKGHLDVGRYLPSRGADPNVQSLCGATPLQFAAEHGHLDIVRQLLGVGARVLTNGIGMTPLLAAAERIKAEVMESLVKQSRCTRREKIDLLELLGASFANKDSCSLERAFRFLELPMRGHEREPRHPKERGPVVAAYDSRVECASLDELYRIGRSRSTSERWPAGRTSININFTGHADE
ncbi:hypothetical protein HPB48_011057 [Haemaphysalis longicornis]|uniref:Uncharacterized protein n=1 Tax=Haemaphysalis longicornis TaxID=44386 RepID=A0A9J6FAG4_HAELO|nr:hypothetical protein HPB48_011057 [Haemaphysalis longicornis]